MPVVNTANFVDRLRDITKRIDIRPSLQNVSKRWNHVYEALAVGSPQQVQEFYKYIKVYKQCPANDLLFMNMTVQLARASMFPTKGMFKQMFKFEKHMDGLILAEGFHGIYGSRGIEILCGHNDHLLRSYRRYKRHSETKRADQEMKTARKNAKQMAALREVRAKSKMPAYEAPVYPFESLIPGEGPIPARAPKVLETSPKATSEVLSPEAQDIVVKELSEVKKYCEILKAQMEEAEKKREEDDVANKLNEVVEKLISTNNLKDNDDEDKKNVDDEDESIEKQGEDDEYLEEEEDDDDQEPEDQLPEMSESVKLPDFQACNITEQQKKAIMRILLGVTEDSDDKQGVVEVTEEKKIEEPSDDEEEIEKIDDKDLDAMEYEML